MKRKKERVSRVSRLLKIEMRWAGEGKGGMRGGLRVWAYALGVHGTDTKKEDHGE